MGNRVRDIRLLDSYLTAGGAGLTVLGLLVMPWFDGAGRFVPFVALAGIGLLGLGRAARSSEQRAIDLWKTLDASREVSVSDLTLTTGWTQPRILKNLAFINTIRGVDYVHLPEKDLIVDRRLMRTVPVVSRCEGCGSTTTERVSILLHEAPACAHCGGGMMTDLNEQKRALLDRLKAEAAEYEDPAQFNGCLFLILWIMPLAAIGYAGVMLKKHLDRSAEGGR